MDFIDIFIIVLLSIGAIRGLWNGFFAELASLISLLIGIWAALTFSAKTAVILQNYVSWEPVKVHIVAFIFTFLLVVVGIGIVGKILTKTAGIIGLGIVNKIMGAVIGILKSVLIVSVLLNTFSKINVDGAIISKETIDNSKLYQPITKVAAALYPAIASWYAEWQLQLKASEATSTHEEL